jgi:hypothetical protein
MKSELQQKRICTLELCNVQPILVDLGLELMAEELTRSIYGDRCTIQYKPYTVTGYKAGPQHNVQRKLY